MRLLKKIVDFYVFSNIHVGIAAACFAMVSMYNSRGEYMMYFSYYIFFSTVLAYHFIRVFENCECTFIAVSAYLKKQPIEVLSVGIIAFLGTSFFGFKIGFNALWILIPSAFLTFWYAVPLFKYKGERISLRNYPTVKMLSIALVWAMVTVLFPLQDYLTESRIWIEFVQRFFLIMALALPFDIRDLNKDELHLQTLPQKIGVLKAKRVGIQFLVLFFILSFFKFPLSANTILIELVIFILSLLLLVKTKPIQSKYYTAFWVESIPIIWLFIILVFVVFKSEVANFG